MKTPKLSIFLLLAAGACADNQAALPPATPLPPTAAATVPPLPPAVATTTSAATPMVATSPTPQVREVPPITSSGSTLTWYGHAAFKLVTPSGKVIFFDPWITNPKNPTGKDDLAKIDKADLILVSHGHFDHVGDAVAIGKKTHAKLVSTFDVGRGMVAYDGYPKEAAGFDTQGNVGGDITLLDGEVKVTFVPAIHSSTVSAQDSSGNAFGDLRPGGTPGGFVVSVKNGPVIYHTGDTDLFSDMSLIQQFHPVTVMLACIGDHFTMGPERAAEAVRLVGPALAVPMHYGTFPVLYGTPEAFDAAVKAKGVRTQVRPMQVHEVLKL